VPVVHETTGREHGRVDRRILKVVTVATGIVFSQARQAIQITRTTRPLNGTKWTTEVVYAVTQPGRRPGHRSRSRTVDPGHWSIENRLPWFAT
jgi:hypothetical protein